MDANGQLVVPLRLGGFEVSVRFTDDRGLDMEQIVDANIEVTGVASVGVDIHGNLTDLTILAGSATAVKVLTAPPDPASLPVEDLKSIMGRSTPADHRVRLRGVVVTRTMGKGLVFLAPRRRYPLPILTESIRLPVTSWIWWALLITPTDGRLATLRMR